MPEYWNVTGVTKPQHYYPFSETGNYTDQGATGGLDLTAAGTGNSFSGGLVLNGSGWATLANNADVCDLGATWSILVEGSILSRESSFQCTICAGTRSTDGYDFFLAWSGTDAYFHGGGQACDFAGSYTDGTNYQMIVTCNGSTTSAWYANGSPINTLGVITLTDGVSGLLVGKASDGYAMTGTIKRMGILKGTAWSSENVTAIYAQLGAASTSFSRGAYADLPGTAVDLTTIYDATDMTAIALDDANRVSQSATAQYAIHQYKEAVTASSVSVTWNGQTNIPPATSVIKLQVYKVSTTTWEDLATKSSGNANEDFNLTGTVPDTTNYLSSGVMTFRVYQLAQ